jgi:hypothetical protein
MTDQLTAIEDYTCAYETWNALHAAHAATCNARHMHIRGQLASLRLDGVETIREYGRRAIDIRRSLLDVGATCGEEELVDYVLLGLPSSYHTIRTIVGDSKESNLEEVLRRLARYQEQELKQGSDTPGSGVALSSQEGRHSSQTTHHHQRHQKKQDHKRMTCYNCNKKGHIAVNCRLPPMKNKDGDSSHSSHGRALIATALAASAHESATNWVVDTGATHHMTSDPSCLTHIQQWQIKTIVFGGGDTVSVIGQGDCLVKSFVASKCHVLTLKNVLLLDKLSFNLLSVAQMTAKGAHVHVTADLCLVKDGGEVLMEAAKRDGLFKAILRPASSPAK